MENKQSKKISEISQSIFKSLIDLTHPCFDPIRKKIRYEQIAAAIYFYSRNSYAQSGWDPKEFILTLINNQNVDGWWDEYPYGVDDENIGFSGLVTTSFVILALSEYYALNSDQNILGSLLKACDTIYFRENNGYIVKATENKSDVLNTNLIAAIAISNTCKVLPQSSNRKRLYSELVSRVIRRTLSYQMPNGFFPYHHHSKAVPFLYHAMVCAQLNLLQREYNSGILELVLTSGKRRLISLFDEQYKLKWHLANNKDKEGSIWAYSFSLASGLPEHINEGILKNLELKDNLLPGSIEDDRPDPFFSSWALFGLCWASSDSSSSETSFEFKDFIRLGIFRVYYLLGFLKFLCMYTKNKFDNFLFQAGALENKKWIK